MIIQTLYSLNNVKKSDFCINLIYNKTDNIGWEYKLSKALSLSSVLSKDIVFLKTPSSENNLNNINSRYNLTIYLFNSSLKPISLNKPSHDIIIRDIFNIDYSFVINDLVSSIIKFTKT